MALNALSLNIRGVRGKETYLVSLIKRYKPDLLLLQETYIPGEVEAKRFLIKMGLKEGNFSHGDTRSRGTCTLLCSDKWTMTNKMNDKLGRTDYTKVTDGDHTLNIINTYAPKRGKQHDYFESLYIYNKNFLNNDPVIWAGDYNNEPREETREVNKMREVLSTLNIKHTLDNIDKISPQYTFDHRYPNIKTKRILDRFYIPVTISEIKVTHIHTCGYTDHWGVLLELKINEQLATPRKSAYWKLNNSVLEDVNFTEEVNTLLKSTREEMIKDQSHAKEMWETTKLQIKRIAIRYSTYQNRKQNAEIEILEKALTVRNKSNTKITSQIKDKLEGLLETKYKGAAVRSKLNNEERDQYTKYYLAREANVQRNRTINQIMDETGNLKSNTCDIKEAFQKYYQNLYSEENSNAELRNKYCRFAKTATNNQKENLDNTRKSVTPRYSMP